MLNIQTTIFLISIRITLNTMMKCQSNNAKNEIFQQIFHIIRQT